MTTFHASHTHTRSHRARVRPQPRREVLVLPRFVEVWLARWIGCTNYADYMHSFIWRSKRERALRRAKFACQVCNATTHLEGHHREYTLPYGTEPDDDVTVLCETCHKRYHGKE